MTDNILRGIEAVVPPAKIVAGRFYLTSKGHVALGCPHADKGAATILLFRPDLPNLRYSSVALAASQKPLVLLPGVRVRVDRGSLVEESGRTAGDLGHLGVAGSQPFISAHYGEHGEIVVDLQTGATIDVPDDALYFTKWSLVIGDQQQEETLLTITSAK